MSRRAIAPGVWLDEGPQTPVTRYASGYVARPAANVGSMTPLFGGPSATHDERQRRRDAQKRYKARQRHAD